MAYFAVVVARGSTGWTAAETELDGVDDFEDLVELLRAAAEEEAPALLLLEQEDLWFGVVRVDGEDDPRVFVSDAAAARRSAIGELLLAGPHLGGVATVAGEEDAEEDAEEDPAPRSSGPLGDADVLDDVGMPFEDLEALCTASGVLPTDALSEIARRAGFLDELEALR